MEQRIRTDTLQVRVGTLYLDDCKRYSLREKGVEPEYEIQFSCGRPIEIYLDGRYIPGRVEHDRDGYYFIADQGSTCRLMEGMRARYQRW